MFFEVLSKEADIDSIVAYQVLWEFDLIYEVISLSKLEIFLNFIFVE